MKVRALRNETRLGVGNWTKDFRKGDVYDVPDEVGQVLTGTGTAIEVSAKAESDQWFDSTTETDAQIADRVKAAEAKN